MFSKGLMIFSCAVFAVTWVAVLVSWFIYGEFPHELATYSTIMFTVLGTGYYGKSCVENKANIEASYLRKKNDR